MSNKSKKHFNGSPAAKTRRTGVIVRLQTQLKTGMKPASKPARGIDITPDDQDIIRINKELATLKMRA